MRAVKLHADTAADDPDVSTVFFCNDLTPRVLDEALSTPGVGLIVTYRESWYAACGRPVEILLQLRAESVLMVLMRAGSNL